MGSRGVVGRRAAFGAVTALVVGGLTVTVGPAYADHSVVELVTTSAAAGNGPFDADPVGATDDGSRVFFETEEPMVASDTDTEQDVYERTGGVTTLVSTDPGDATSTPALASFGKTSADGTHVFFETAQQLVPGDTDTNTDTYERTGGQTTLLTGGSALADAQFRGASPVVGRVLFDTVEALAPEDTDASRDIYEAVGGAVHLVWTSATPADTDALRDVYLRSNGQTSLVSVGTTTGAVNGDDLSADGTHVVFSTNESLDPADTDAEEDLYQWVGRSAWSRPARRHRVVSPCATPSRRTGPGSSSRPRTPGAAGHRRRLRRLPAAGRSDDAAHAGYPDPRGVHRLVERRDEGLLPDRRRRDARGHRRPARRL